MEYKRENECFVVYTYVEKSAIGDLPVSALLHLWWEGGELPLIEAFKEHRDNKEDFNVFSPLEESGYTFKLSDKRVAHPELHILSELCILYHGSGITIADA